MRSSPFYQLLLKEARTNKAWPSWGRLDHHLTSFPPSPTPSLVSTWPLLLLSLVPGLSIIWGLSTSFSSERAQTLEKYKLISLGNVNQIYIFRLEASPPLCRGSWVRCWASWGLTCLLLAGMLSPVTSCPPVFSAMSRTRTRYAAHTGPWWHHSNYTLPTPGPVLDQCWWRYCQLQLCQQVICQHIHHRY